MANNNPFLYSPSRNGPPFGNYPNPGQGMSVHQTFSGPTNPNFFIFQQPGQYSISLQGGFSNGNTNNGGQPGGQNCSQPYCRAPASPAYQMDTVKSKTYSVATGMGHANTSSSPSSDA